MVFQFQVMPKLLSSVRAMLIILASKVTCWVTLSRAFTALRTLAPSMALPLKRMLLLMGSKAILPPSLTRVVSIFCISSAF